MLSLTASLFSFCPPFVGHLSSSAPFRPIFRGGGVGVYKIWPRRKSPLRNFSRIQAPLNQTPPRLPPKKLSGNYPLIQNDYRQEKIIFEFFWGALQENPVRAPGATTGGALTGQGPIQETIFGEFVSGALQENPVIAPGQLHEKMFAELSW